MKTAKKAKENEQGSDLLENQEALAEQISKTEQYLEQKFGDDYLDYVYGITIRHVE